MHGKALFMLAVLLAATAYVGHDATATMLDTDRDEITLGQDLTIRLVEPDANIDARSIDTIPLRTLLISTDKFDETPLDQVLQIVSDRAAKAGKSAIRTDHQSLRETDFNSGIFEVTLRSINDLLVNRDKDIRIVYVDNTSSGAGSPARVEKIVHVGKSTIAVKFSKSEYTPSDTVEITVMAQIFNANRNRIDTLNTPTGSYVAVTTPTGVTYYPPMFETDVNTGTFVGKIKLKSDLNENGDLVVRSGDRIRVTVTITPGFEISGSVLVASRLGSISFDKEMYDAGDTVAVTVLDPDGNKNDSVQDEIQVMIWSGSDPDGKVIALGEQGSYSGIFGSKFTIGAEPTMLLVSDDDMIFAKYIDATVPAQYDYPRAVLASAKVGNPVHAVMNTKPELLDKDGVQVAKAKSGELVVLRSSLVSARGENQDFVYLVQVSDANGFTVQTSFVKGVLEPFQTLKIARSWIPAAAGEYDVQITVWDSLDRPTVLSPMKKNVLDVEN